RLLCGRPRRRPNRVRITSTSYGDGLDTSETARLPDHPRRPACNGPAAAMRITRPLRGSEPARKRGTDRTWVTCRSGAVPPVPLLPHVDPVPIDEDDVPVWVRDPHAVLRMADRRPQHDVPIRVLIQYALAHHQNARIGHDVDLVVVAALGENCEF